jgi:predicted RNA-binding Zn ribbon-like protein
LKNIVGEREKILRLIERAAVPTGSAVRTVVANPARSERPLSLSNAASVIKLKTAVALASAKPTANPRKGNLRICGECEQWQYSNSQQLISKNAWRKTKTAYRVTSKFREMP